MGAYTAEMGAHTAEMGANTAEMGAYTAEMGAPEPPPQPHSFGHLVHIQ